MQQKKYNLIDIHMHPLHPIYIDYISKTLKYWDDKCRCFPWSEEEMFGFMDELGIDLGFLSISSPCINSGKDAEACRVVREVNEATADLVSRNYDRLRLFACLPLPDVPGALEEAVFALDELHASGISLVSNFNGLYMGHPALEPLYQALNQRNAIVFLHPACPSAVPKGVLDDMAIPMLEFMFDTTRSMLNLMRNGVLERYPNIRFIVPHCGGTLPWLIDRLMQAQKFSGMSKNGYEQLGKFYYDVAGGSVPRQLGLLLDLIPEDHILFGTDYNWFDIQKTQAKFKLLGEAPYLNSSLLEKIYHENAEKLFGL